MSEQSPESPAAKPPKDTAESLNEMLWAKADAELKSIIDRHINLTGLEADVAPVRGGAWKRVCNLNINELGIQDKVWAPSLISAAREATFVALRDYHRNRYVEAFIHRITNMQDELESLQAQVG